jgi:transposase
MNSADGLGLTTWLASAEGAESGARSPNLGLARSGELSGRLDHIPDIGPALATAPVASIADPSLSIGTDFSTWIGLIPNQNSSGGKDKLGNISKRHCWQGGDGTTRRALMVF